MIREKHAEGREELDSEEEMLLEADNKRIRIEELQKKLDEKKTDIGFKKKGHFIERYTIGKHIGQGAHSKVFLA